MEKYSEKAFLKTGIIDELKNKVFIKNGVDFLFYMWDYQKGRNLFCFRLKDDIKKPISEPCQTLLIQLYKQHLNDYKNTLQLIYKAFDEIKEQ